MSRLSSRNYALNLVYTVSQYTALYWPYMYHYTTAVRGLSAAEFGVLKGLYYATVVVCELPFGVIADRLGRKGVLVLGALTTVAGCGLYVVGRGFGAFAAAEILFGIGTALVSGAGSALLYDSFEADGRAGDYPRAEGRCRSAALIAATIGLPATDLWLVRGDDPVLAYAATAVIAAIGVACAAALREPPVERRASAIEISRGVLADVRGNASLRELLLYGAGVFILMRAANGLVFNPVMEAGGIPVRVWGTITAVLGLLGALAAWQTPNALGRWGERGVQLALPAMLVAMYAGLATFPGAALLVCVHGIAVGALPVVVLTGLNRRVPSWERRATLLSVESLVSRGCYAIVAAIVGFLLARAPLYAVLWLTLALGCVPLALATLSGRLRRR